MQLFESRTALESAEAAKRQLQKDNKQLTVRREELQNKLNLTRRDMDQEGGEMDVREGGQGAGWRWGNGRPDIDDTCGHWDAIAFPVFKLKLK